MLQAQFGQLRQTWAGEQSAERLARRHATCRVPLHDCTSDQNDNIKVAQAYEATQVGVAVSRTQSPK